MEKKPVSHGRGHLIPATNDASAPTIDRASTNVLPSLECLSIGTSFALETSQDPEGKETSPMSALVNIESLSQCSASSTKVSAESNQFTEDENEDKTKSDVPKTKIEAAHEFRMDATLSPSPMKFHFFCCICGCCAGQDCYTCSVKGHPVCQLCKNELKIEACPYVIVDKSKYQICGYNLIQIRSTFREFMFQNTIVGCLYRAEGCEMEGVWDDIKEHQETCEYSKMKQ